MVLIDASGISSYMSCRNAFVYNIYAVTAKLMVALVEPKELLPDTVYVVSAAVPVGVPVISPVVVLRARPVGSAGLTLKALVTAPPWLPMKRVYGTLVRGAEGRAPE